MPLAIASLTPRSSRRAVSRQAAIRVCWSNQVSSRAVDRINAEGLAIPFPAMSGAVPCKAEAPKRFVSPMFAVGVRLKRDDRLHIAAPFGLADLFALRLRPNPRRFSANFTQVAAGVSRRWPEITVEGAILERVHRRHVINRIIT